MRALSLVAVGIMLLAGADDARAQTKEFSGVYLGLEAGRQSLIGGSLVGGVDVLTQEDRAVAHPVASRWIRPRTFSCSRTSPRHGACST